MLLEETIKCKEDIKSFNIKKIYEDDNLICVDLEINGIDISFDYYDDIEFLYLWKYEEESFNKLLSSIEVYYDIEFDR